MNKQDIQRLFEEMNDLLAEKGISGELLICGGALMALSYNKERVTEDIDALYMPKEDIEEVVRLISKKNKLPDNWLNDMVSQSINLAALDSISILSFSNLTIRAVTLEVLLTMKLMACRDKDMGDIKYLVARLGCFDFDKVMELVLKYAPKNRLMYAPHFLTSIFAGMNEKEMARLHYMQFHHDESLVDGLAEFAADYTFPFCRSLQEILEMECHSEIMKNAQGYVRYLVDEAGEYKELQVEQSE